MHPVRSSLSLRQVLLADAATCAAMGAVLALGAGAIGELTAIPAPLLRYAGIILAPVAVYMVLVACLWRDRLFAVRLVVLGNALWVAGSLALALGLIAPNALGLAFILTQAAVVAVFAWAERAAFRGAPGAVAAGQEATS